MFEAMSSSLDKHIDPAIATLAQMITAWPPIEGKTAVEGEDAIKNMMMDNCEPLLSNVNSEREVILRSRALELTDQELQILKRTL